MNLNADILNSYQAYDRDLLDRLLEEEIHKNERKIVVLDDDPTGVQTVHGVCVYTDWKKETMTEAFQEEDKMFFIRNYSAPRLGHINFGQNGENKISVLP